MIGVIFVLALIIGLIELFSNSGGSRSSNSSSNNNSSNTSSSSSIRDFECYNRNHIYDDDFDPDDYEPCTDD